LWWAPELEVTGSEANAIKRHIERAAQILAEFTRDPSHRSIPALSLDEGATEGGAAVVPFEEAFKIVVNMWEDEADDALKKANEDIRTIAREIARRAVDQMGDTLREREEAFLKQLFEKSRAAENARTRDLGEACRRGGELLQAVRKADVTSWAVERVGGGLK
jgi:hypothetical protein